MSTPDTIAKPAEMPAQPALSSYYLPTMADLMAYAQHMQRIADGCDITKEAGQPMNPYACIGALRSLTEQMVGLLKHHVAEEQRSLLLMDRLRHESNIESAHEKLMSEDSDYADEYEDEAS